MFKWLCLVILVSSFNETGQYVRIDDTFTELMKKAKASFQAEDYSVIIKAKAEKTDHNIQ